MIKLLKFLYSKSVSTGALEQRLSGCYKHFPSIVVSLRTGIACIGNSKQHLHIHKERCQFNHGRATPANFCFQRRPGLTSPFLPCQPVPQSLSFAVPQNSASACFPTAPPAASQPLWGPHSPPVPGCRDTLSSPSAPPVSTVQLCDQPTRTAAMISLSLYLLFKNAVGLSRECLQIKLPSSSQ